MHKSYRRIKCFEIRYSDREIFDLTFWQIPFERKYNKLSANKYMKRNVESNSYLQWVSKRKTVQVLAAQCQVANLGINDVTEHDLFANPDSSSIKY